MSKMNNSQLKHHLAFTYAKKHQFHPSTRVTSRRSAKSQGNGTGMVLKNSRVVGINIERVFNHPSWRNGV